MPSTLDTNNHFIDWLDGKLKLRGWTQAELARQMGVQQSVIGNIVNRRVAMGVEVARKVAAALEISQYEVFREAGLIDEELLDDEEALHETRRLLAQIHDNDELERVLKFIEAIAREASTRQKQAQKSRPKHSTRPGLAHDDP